MEIPTDIVKFFPNLTETSSENHPLRRTIGEYLVKNHLKINNSLNIGECLRIVSRLVEQEILIPGGRVDEGDSPYKEVYYTAHFSEEAAEYGVYDFIAYGFPYIREHFKNSVQAIVVEHNGNTEIGSGFLLKTQWFVTCKHCIENMEKVMVTNLDFSTTPLSKIWVPIDERIDLAILQFDGDPFPNIPGFCLEEANILDDVLTMGYPPIPGYDSILTAEKAQIAGHLKSTTGQAIAEEKMYLDQQTYLPISARVKGGNSGGPVVGRRGAVVGIVSQLPAGEEARPDTIGYAAAIPYKTLEILKNSCLESNSQFIKEMRFENVDGGFRTNF